MIQKLDSLSKIMIATGQINYMSVSIDSVNEQIKFIPEPHRAVHEEGIKAADLFLAHMAKQLSELMNEIGDFINNSGGICTIDERVAKVPFEILVHGMDECENDYENED